MTWQEGSVDRSGEHIELRYSDASHAGNDQWTPVALIGRPTGLVFPARWLAEPDVPREVIAEVRHELDFYLVEKAVGSVAVSSPNRIHVADPKRARVTTSIMRSIRKNLPSQ